MCPKLGLLLFGGHSFPLCPLLRLLQSEIRVIHIRAAHDGVTLEDAPCPPAVDLHDDSLGHSGTSKVSRPRSSQMVKDCVCVSQRRWITKARRSQAAGKPSD